MLGASLFASVARAESKDLSSLAARTKPSVVLVSLFDTGGNRVGSGSGFFVTAGGQVVTNHHVIDEASSATVSLSDGRQVPVTGLLVDDVEHDIAIVQVSREGGDFPPLPLGDTATLRAGDDVVVVGSPLGLSTTVSPGVVSALRADGLSKEGGFKKEYSKYTDAWDLQITAPIAPGSSGSPILNGSGEVVGVAVGELTGGQNLNFGIATRYVKGAMAKAVSARVRPLGAVPERMRNLAISALVALLLGIAWVVVPRIANRRAKRRKGLPRGEVTRPR